MPWFNIGGSATAEASGLAETQYVLAGGHGYATQAEAKAHPASAAELVKLAAEGIATWNEQSPAATAQTAIAGGHRRVLPVEDIQLAFRGGCLAGNGGPHGQSGPWPVNGHRRYRASDRDEPGPDQSG
jgi:hypothetical protein